MLAVLAAEVIAVIVAMATTRWQDRDLLLFTALIACGAAMVEATRDIKTAHGTVGHDMQAVWYLTMAVLLPPVYALVAPIPLIALKLSQRRQSAVLYRQVFSVAANGLAYASTSVVCHALPRAFAGPKPGDGAHVLTWTAALAASGALGLALNNGVIFTAIKLSDPRARLSEMIKNREAAIADLLQLSLAVVVAFTMAINPFLLLAGLPIVLAQRRFVMHGQLVAQTRIDAKTGLLNAGAWHHEAGVELSRAVRTHTPLAVAIVDIDHFTTVNDTVGHQDGDHVLRSIADTLREHLRDYDLVGRIGGEEFAVLLPHTRADEARRIAERLRDRVAREPVSIEDGSHAGFVFRLTVSIGVAALGHPGGDLSGVVAAAHRALVEAKSTGRNRVCTADA
jgi:diguanylate cyclase (GGDEF)-like protein